MRLIDADELKKALAEMWYERNIKITGLSVAELIDDAPTIEPSGDLVNRKTLIGAIEKCGEEKIYPQALIEVIKALPSAEPSKSVKYKSNLLDTTDRPKGEWIDREDSKSEPYIPEASTERVVHCKDCIYSSQPDGEELFLCGNRFGMSGWVREDEFCSSGSL